MKRYIIIEYLRYILLLLFGINSIMPFAQEYEVLSFEVKQNDMTARTNSRVDANGRKCAVVKVYADDKITVVRGAVVGDIESVGMEKQVYMAHDAKQMELVFENHYPLTIMFIDYGIPSLTGQMTYVCKLQKMTANDTHDSSDSIAYHETPVTTIEDKIENNASKSPTDIVNDDIKYLDEKLEIIPYSGALWNFDNLYNNCLLLDFKIKKVTFGI